MIEIKNYIKDGDDFIPIEEFNGTVPDPEYIDSAMELSIDGIPIITRAEWDYMIPLWSYIANGFEELTEKPEKSEWATYFPDQPIKLTFRVDKKSSQIEVELYSPKCDLTDSKEETRRAKTDLNEFLTAMSETGKKFFLRIAEIMPEERTEYEDDARRMQDTATKLKQSIYQ